MGKIKMEDKMEKLMNFLGTKILFKLKTNCVFKENSMMKVHE